MFQLSLTKTSSDQNLKRIVIWEDQLAEGDTQYEDTRAGIHYKRNKTKKGENKITKNYRVINQQENWTDQQENV